MLKAQFPLFPSKCDNKHDARFSVAFNLIWYFMWKFISFIYSFPNSAIKIYLFIYFSELRLWICTIKNGMRDNLLTQVGGQKWLWRNCGREKLTLKIRKHILQHIPRPLNELYNRYWLLTTSGPSMPVLDTVAPNHWFDFVSICSFFSL